jgi:hypothetical protein
VHEVLLDVGCIRGPALEDCAASSVGRGIKDVFVDVGFYLMPGRGGEGWGCGVEFELLHFLVVGSGCDIQLFKGL